MGIVRVKEFEEEFEQEEIEIYALLREAPNGAAVYSKDCLRPLAYTEATVDCKTGRWIGVRGFLPGLFRQIMKRAGAMTSSSMGFTGS